MSQPPHERLPLNHRLALCGVSIIASLLLITPVTGQTVGRESKGQGQDESIEIRLDELPKPPTEFAKLIHSGAVRLITGGQPTSDPDSLPAGRRLAGETRFTFRYRYDSRARWQVETRLSGAALGQAMVLVRVRFRSLQLITTHEVWIRDPPPSDQFWDNRVVRHEFDHVRISSDPRIEKHFLDAAKEMEQMRVPLSSVAGAGAGGRVENAKVQALIEAGMKQALDDTTDLVRVRYRELDRLTEHGMLPLPRP
ncbi:hypothetical protein Mal15_40130 [Stieleria maiorica]|uniref:DUF922 domain-containing protein n=1 Tax=Stieleria maiorica TaxID=2795974 RepID=A0A5B9MIW2_9BACT|nr:hypothetical protein [Stieleria maiorica]QEF99946.1 hypothetical protein Mal15_40130 [Stieleria maiorica]